MISEKITIDIILIFAGWGLIIWLQAEQFKRQEIIAKAEKAASILKNLISLINSKPISKLNTSATERDATALISRFELKINDTLKTHKISLISSSDMLKLRSIDMRKIKKTEDIIDIKEVIYETEDSLELTLSSALCKPWHIKLIDSKPSLAGVITALLFLNLLNTIFLVIDPHL
ncbi:hypothetical protein [Pseudomonas leptonychotis]|uniref:hypothetical protein n=1 Tax=Pseudomonas leptonychotis TaxID=2448482 RepID=UPI003867E25F